MKVKESLHEYKEYFKYGWTRGRVYLMLNKIYVITSKPYW